MTDYIVGESYTSYDFYGENRKDIIEFKVLALSANNRVKIRRMDWDYDQWVDSNMLYEKSTYPVRGTTKKPWWNFW